MAICPVPNPEFLSIAFVICFSVTVLPASHGLSASLLGAWNLELLMTIYESSVAEKATIRKSLCARPALPLRYHQPNL